VESYASLAKEIESAPSGAEITFCPFFLRKISSFRAITVKTGVKVTCARISPDEFCTIIGLGTHLIINTSEDTRWQGFNFRKSNDHAVHISGDVENAELATHTFCQTSFVENVRTKDTRGGALMLGRSAGTVNIVESFFEENFSSTYGAAIYSRTSQLNIIYSLFQKNKSNGYGPAIYTAQGGGLMIKTTTFLSNNGREGHDVAFYPGEGEGRSIYEDGFDNGSNDADCRGVYDLAIKSCIVFEKSLPTPFPTTRPTNLPTSHRPTKIPTAPPTKIVTTNPTKPPIVAIVNNTAEVVNVPPTNTSPTGFPTATSTKKPIASPTNEPSITIPTTKGPMEIISKPTGPSAPASQKPIVSPTNDPTITIPITKSPVEGVNKPTGFPAPTSTQEPIASPTNKPTINVSVESVVSKPSATQVPMIVKPTIQLTTGPMVTVGPPTMMPTPKVIDTTKGHSDFGKDISNLCVFRAIPKERECVDAKSFREFKSAIKSAIESEMSDIIFCGGFNLRKSGASPVEIDRDIDIRCVENCSFFGIGPFAKIGGFSKIRLQNLKFLNSQDSSAVIVSTISPASKTTFCETDFARNQVSQGIFSLGGALTIESRSGIVNIVNNTFTGNIASHGGAIRSEGFKLNVVGSKFIANNAYHSGNAIFVGTGNHLFIESSSFILNTEAASETEDRGGSSKSVAIAVQPDKSIRNSGSHNGKVEDGGSNEVILSGACEGFFILRTGFCDNFRQ